MSLRERIDEEAKSALKSGDKERVGVLRMLRAKILETEVAARAGRGRGASLGDPEVVEAVASYAKQRKDSIEAFRRAGREDLASKEESELRIVEEYLPQPLGEGEIRAVVLRAIAESGARSPKDMGAVMKLAMPQVKGAADGKKVQEIVKELLAPAKPLGDL